MKLIKFEVTNYKCIFQSRPVKVGDITCLVGKNEAGKTALLKALYALNPIRPEDTNFSVTDDFPRVEVSDYEDDVSKGKRTPSKVIEVQYELDQDEIAKVESVFGPNFFITKFFEITKFYNNERALDIHAHEKEAIKFITRDFSTEIKQELQEVETSKQLLEKIEPHAADPAVAAVIDVVRKTAPHGFAWYAANEILREHEPKFMYFDEYYQMTGCENIQALQQRVGSHSLKPSDQPLLGLIELARLNLDQLLSPERTQDLKNKLEGAGVHLTQKILPFWSQNRHLQMRFDVRPALPKDPPEMHTGTNIWGEVYDTKHFASTSLGSRSRGFVWFFSFVAWYAQIQRANSNVIILLDEPGLTLHGKAQGDLLRYFEQELKPHHQLIYTTHSPFMVDPHHFERVRIVQDLSIDKDDLPREQEGTKVTEEVFEATEDSLFPLQGALGYEIHQTLFIGPNSLLIEGPADMFFLQGMSSLLEREGRQGLSQKWILTPVGGASRIPTFVRFLTNQKDMRIATLIDIQNKDRGTIESLYKDKLLKKGNVRTFADYTSAQEADIEDMFEPDFYLDLVNREYVTALQAPLKLGAFQSTAPRILVRIETYLATAPLQKGTFGHYRPARFFHENLASLTQAVSEGTKDRFEKAFKDLNALLRYSFG
jgi:predicted ATP-dependent endonuclease of OLD family